MRQLLPSSSVSRYQRFLAEELGQLLHAQLSQQPNQQPSTLDRQLSGSKGPDNDLEGQQPLRPDGQLLTFHGHRGQLNGSLHKDAIIAWGSQLAKHAADFSSGQIRAVPRGSNQQCYKQTGIQTGVWPALGLSQRVHGSQQPFGLTTNLQTVRSDNSVAGVTAHPQGLLPSSQELQEEVAVPRALKGRHQDTKEPGRRTLNASRASSPLRRQVMLQSRLGLFDSDSSSSSDDEVDGDITQVGLRSHSLYRMTHDLIAAMLMTVV